MDRTALQGAVLNQKAALLRKEEVPPAWVLPLSAGIHRAQLPLLCFPLNNREKSRGKGDVPEIKALFLAARIAQGMGWLGADGGGARSHLSQPVGFPSWLPMRRYSQHHHARAAVSQTTAGRRNLQQIVASGLVASGLLPLAKPSAPRGHHRGSASALHI